MKKLFTALIFSLCLHSAYSQIDLPDIRYTPLDPPQNVLQTTVLENGKYNAIVKYHTSSTQTKSTYSLKVDVSDDRVIRIYFPNGGYINSGYNSEGYTYSGGDLRFYTDQYGNLDSADTTVKVYRSGRYEYYYIEL